MNDLHGRWERLRARRLFLFHSWLIINLKKIFLAALPVNFVAMGTVGVVGQKCHDLCSRFVRKLSLFSELLQASIVDWCFRWTWDAQSHTPLINSKNSKQKKVVAENFFARSISTFLVVPLLNLHPQKRPQASCKNSIRTEFVLNEDDDQCLRMTFLPFNAKSELPLHDRTGKQSFPECQKSWVNSSAVFALLGSASKPNIAASDSKLLLR